MISSDEIKQIYEEKLEPQLKEMDKDRKRLFWLTIPMIICGIGFFIGLAMDGWLSWVIMIGAIILLIYLGIKYSTSYSSYHTNFKEKVVREIVKAINPDYQYSSEDRIDPEHYFASNLFEEEYDKYDGDDMVIGAIDKTEFQFSELHTQELEVYYDSDGDRQERWETIFRGIYFFATFNKELGEQTKVVPEKAHRTLLGRERKKVGGLDIVKLENPEFEKIFSVYGTSQQEARYVLTPVMMEAMVQIYNLYKRKMSFSFIGANVYCAIPMSKDNFEPKVWKRVKYKDVEEMFSLFSLVEVIVNEMNLNTRIWTKD